MRNIAIKAKEAFDEGRRLSMGNTKVISSLETTSLYLFKHEIVRKDYEGLKITTAGFNTRTTRDRLSAFINVRSTKGQLVINNKFPWDGEWLNLTEYEQDNNLYSL